MNNIHPTAVVHPSARVDPTAQVGPYAVVGEEAVIGPGTVLGPHAFVEHATLGRDNRLHSHCSVGAAPQDLKYRGEKTRLVMGDGNVVREFVSLHRATPATGETRIGSGCMFMACSHVAHDCRIGDRVILVNSVGLAGHVQIDDNAIIGGLAGVHQFVRIGRYCMVGGGSMVGKDIPPFCTCQGDRARLRGLNLVGLRRAGFSRDAVRAIKETYRTLFLSGLPLEEALRRAESSGGGAEAQEMVSFVRGAGKRGVLKAAARSSAEEEAVL